MTPPNDGLQEVIVVARALDGLGIRWALGGSLASSLHGAPRFTHDADLAVDPFPGRETELAGCFGEDYYLSKSAMIDANRRRASFKIIHTTTGFKVDVFVRPDRGFDVEALGRAVSVELQSPLGGRLRVFTPEDVVLFKLEWYRKGDETSDRQWQDAIGVLRSHAGRLDESYLRRCAAEIGVADLLERSLGEAAA